MLAVAGLPTSSLQAQNFSFSLIPSTTQVAPGAAFTATMYADANLGTHLISSIFRLNASTLGNSPTSNITWTPAPWSTWFNKDGGYANNGNYNEVAFSYFHTDNDPAPLVGSALGHFTFTVSEDWDGRSTFFAPVRVQPFSIETYDPITNEYFRGSGSDIEIQGFRINQIPAPSTSALLTLLLIPACRRQR